jgi:hypothetical protein
MIWIMYLAFYMSITADRALHETMVGGKGKLYHASSSN